ncbi:short-chain dehydrogenase/reductase family 16C member 6 [Parasteatoda tepidariorum]|uniref:short-chain dehydrogenase/reductase family 16C member 6 n=1 Tax=Parasteatoda tepidariorum TaxID=114398 RepID=UPI001C718F88|nr:short-chain dehydrogenase/reductase family 16C member 6 [Parasteatoda tepidariorum]
MGCFRFMVDTIKLFFLMVADPFIRCFWCIFPKPKKSIKGEIILLTGAGHGLGKELAIRLSDLGAVMVLWDINQENNENIASKLRSLGRSVFSYRVDVTNEEEVIRMANRVKQEVGDVTLLVNNAGVFSGQPICKLSSHVIRRCFEVNSLAHFWMLQQFLPRMLELNRGHIVAVASMAGHHGVANMTDYCASKHATVGLMESLYMELHAAKKANIRLTTINPIIITTGLISNVRTRFPCLLPLMPVEETADVIVKSILREEEMVFIPTRSKYLNDMVSCFRRKTRFKILDYTGYGFDPVVEKEPTKNGAEIV